MRLKPFIVTIMLATILSWVAFGFVLLNVDPFHADILGFLFFYLSLFATLIGTFAVVTLFFYTTVIQFDLPVYRVVSKSLQHSAIAASVIVVLLLLQSIRVLTLWNVGLFVIAVLLGTSFYATLQAKRT